MNLVGHQAEVGVIAFHPNKPLLASGDFSGSIRLWNTSTGTLVHKLDHHTYIVNNLLFSSSGKFLISAGQDEIIALWDINTGYLLNSVKGAPDYIDSFILTEKDRLLMINGAVIRGDGEDESTENIDSRWVIKENFEIMNLYSHHVKPSIRLFKDNNDKVIGLRHADNRIWLCDIIDGREIQEIDLSINYPEIITISPNGFFVAIGESLTNDIFLCDLTSGSRLYQFSGHTDAIQGLCFNPNSEILASCSSDGSTKLWSISKGNEIETITEPGNRFLDVMFSPDGKHLAYAGTDRKVVVNPIAREPKAIRRAKVVSSNIASIGYNSDESTLEIEFSNGLIYQFYDIPASVYIELMNSRSHGIYFDANIKKAGYRYKKV